VLTMLNRMCWNSRGWRLPTGNPGRGGDPGKVGFGVEEWNFQIEDQVDGFVYGYLYYKPKAETIQRAEGHFRILFWSIHPDTREKLLVGMYRDATIPMDDDYAKVDREFSSRGIYERRKQELCAAVPSMSNDDVCRNVTDPVTEPWLSFKCPVEEVHHFAEYIPIDEVVKSTTVGQRFTRPTFICSGTEDLQRVQSLTQTSLGAAMPLARPSALAEDGYYRESPQSLKLIVKRHNKLSNDFYRWLKRADYQEIVREDHHVDMSFKRSGKLYLAELKVCYGTGSTKAIREALGQLLEYNYYPGRHLTDYWVIVLDEQPTSDDVGFIRELKHALGIPLYLGWKIAGKFGFAEGLAL